MAKLALVAAILLGACVADDGSTTSPRVDSDDVAGPINVVNEVEIQAYDEDAVNPALVVITGVEIPGRTPTQPNIDISNIDLAELDPQTRQLCTDASTLPNSDVCSQLCSGPGFAARVFDQGTPGGCKETQCSLPGDVNVTVAVCSSDN